jgi:hypothetical protein
LSILLNGPESFKGRKVGALVTDGVDSAILEALKIALEAEGAQLKIVAPMVGGVEAAGDRGGIFGGTDRFRATETAPFRVSLGKAAEGQRLFRRRQESGIAQSCVVAEAVVSDHSLAC